jgi:hypothetical protein
MKDVREVLRVRTVLCWFLCKLNPFFWKDILKNSTFPVFSLSSSPLHVDRSSVTGADQLNALKDIFAEWVILSRMNAIVSSNSGFAQTASCVWRPFITSMKGEGPTCNSFA